MKPKQGDKGLFWGTLAKLGIGLRSGWELRPSWNFCKSSGAILAPDPQSWTIAKSLSFHVFFRITLIFIFFHGLNLTEGKLERKRKRATCCRSKNILGTNMNTFLGIKMNIFLGTNMNIFLCTNMNIFLGTNMNIFLGTYMNIFLGIGIFREVLIK